MIPTLEEIRNEERANVEAEVNQRAQVRLNEALVREEERINRMQGELSSAREELARRIAERDASAPLAEEPLG